MAHIKTFLGRCHTAVQLILVISHIRQNVYMANNHYKQIHYMLISARNKLYLTSLYLTIHYIHVLFSIEVWLYWQKMNRNKLWYVNTCNCYQAPMSKLTWLTEMQNQFFLYLHCFMFEDCFVWYFISCSLQYLVACLVAVSIFSCLCNLSYTAILLWW